MRRARTVEPLGEDRNARGETGAAVDGTIAARAERNRRRDAALGADRLEGRPRCAGTSLDRALRTPRLTAVTAALRLILKAFVREELLLAACKNELIPAIFAGQNLVFQSSEPPLIRS